MKYFYELTLCRGNVLVRFCDYITENEKGENETNEEGMFFKRISNRTSEKIQTYIRRRRCMILDMLECGDRKSVV